MKKEIKMKKKTSMRVNNVTEFERRFHMAYALYNHGHNLLSKCEASKVRPGVSSAVINDAIPC